MGCEFNFSGAANRPGKLESLKAPAVLKAGPTLNNQASDDNSRRPTRQSAPATSPTSQPSLDGATF